MEFTPVEQELYDMLKAHADNKGYILNPDEDVLERVIRGMVKIKDKKGEYYCPCKLVTGNEEIDKKIICPCDYHEADIEKNGHCHCYLFFSKK